MYTSLRLKSGLIFHLLGLHNKDNNVIEVIIAYLEDILDEILEKGEVKLLKRSCVMKPFHPNFNENSSLLKRPMGCGNLKNSWRIR